ncbi:hypothetical protein EDB86DRAFT_3081870 [Lactarius hatsudake]|nr:hypothetical protein EDB86DRAFT_3081870 [Lactarius hatsudake]
MRASCIAFVVLAAAAAPALSASVAARGPGPKLVGSRRSADELIGRGEQVTGLPPPSSPWDETQPINPAHKRSTDTLIDREERLVPPSLPPVSGRDEDISVPPSLLNDREEAIPPTSYNPPPQPINERFTDELIGREGDDPQGWRRTDKRFTDELVGREGDDPQGWRRTDKRFTDELVGREGDDPQGWRRTDKRFTDKLFNRDKAIAARDD